MKKLPKDVKEVAKESKLLQTSDEGLLNDIVDQVLANNPQAVKDLKEGKDKAIGFLVGQVMKGSKGQANPTIVTTLIKSKIG